MTVGAAGITNDFIEELSRKEIEEAKRVAEARQKLVEEQDDNPYNGYSTIEDAINDCRYSSQVEVLARLLNGENLFVSGLAGAGKTSVLNKFLKLVEAEHNGKVNVAITASTGIAATLIEGTTIHSWSGFGIDTEPFDPAKSEYRGYNMKNVDILVIDEISMLPAYLFIKLDAAMRYVRKNERPFGGVQLVLIGDFLQLPPVSKNKNLDNRFCIETELWHDPELDLKHTFLDKTYRATDQRLKRVLLEISANRVSKKTLNYVNSRFNMEPDPEKSYTTLFTTNRNVDKYNLEKFEENPNKAETFTLKRTVGSMMETDKLIRDRKLEETLQFKIGDTVILTRNVRTPKKSNVPNDLGISIANGSIGKVINFVEDTFSSDFTKPIVPLVKFNNGSIRPVRYETYQKVQKEEVKVFDFDKNGNVVTKSSYIDTVVAEVMQIPLKLGYAITVHKSQGQTFDGVIMDLSKCFIDGLGYVALSRVASIDDLIITGFTDRAYKVSPVAIDTMKNVRKAAKANRNDFIDNIELYEPLLSSSWTRKMVREMAS